MFKYINALHYTTYLHCFHYLHLYLIIRKKHMQSQHINLDQQIITLVFGMFLHVSRAWTEVIYEYIALYVYTLYVTRSDGDFYQPMPARWAGSRSAPLTWQPSGRCGSGIPSWTPGGVSFWRNEGFPAAGLPALPAPRCVLPQRLQRKPPGRFYCLGAWKYCGRRRRLIRRLQLIFSPRFSSGKRAGRRWQPCLTVIEWRALRCDTLPGQVVPWLWWLLSIRPRAKTTLFPHEAASLLSIYSCSLITAGVHSDKHTEGVLTDWICNIFLTTETRYLRTQEIINI